MNFPFWTPFTNEWITIFLILVIIISIIILSNISISKKWLSNESTRRLVHILIGLMTIISPIIFTQNIIPIILASLFTIINIFTLKYKIFKGINSINRVTYRTIYFPISYLILSLVFWEYSEFFILSLF